MNALDGILMGVGGMVGGGIFILNGVSIIKAGKYGPISWMIGLCLCLLIAFSYCILTEEYPSSGGTIEYPEKLLDKKETKWKKIFAMIVILGYITLTGVYALGLSNYVTTFFKVPKLTKYMAMIVILLGLLINYFPKKVFKSILNTLVYGKLFIFISIIIIGLILRGRTGIFKSSTESGLPLKDILPVETGKSLVKTLKGGNSSVTPFSIILFGISSFLSYEGFEMISNLSDEMENRKRDIPISFMGSLIITGIIYSLLSYVTNKHIGGSIDKGNMYSSFNNLVHQYGMGSIGTFIVILLAILANFSAINATYFTNNDIWKAYLGYKDGNSSFTKKINKMLKKKITLPFFTEKRQIYIWISTIISCLLVLLPQLVISNLGSLLFFIIFGVVSYMGVLLVRKKEKEKKDVMFFGKSISKKTSKIICYIGLIACIIGCLLLIYDIIRLMSNS